MSDIGVDGLAPPPFDSDEEYEAFLLGKFDVRLPTLDFAPFDFDDDSEYEAFISGSGEARPVPEEQESQAR